MKVTEVLEIIEKNLRNPLDVWPGYSPRQAPMAIFDDQEIAYINHPSPPDERPSGLMAATAMPINEVITAAIPLWMFTAPGQALPLVYHECFHVFQDTGGFREIYPPGYNFHLALAAYPELQPRQRALCWAEAEVYNAAHWSDLEKAALLAALTSQRFAILEQQPLALALAKISERHEGPAFFIQQQVDWLVNETPLPDVPAAYGYSRQYYSGAAACRLLQRLVPDWHLAIQDGAAPSELLLRHFGEYPANLSDLRLEEKTAQEQVNVDAILMEFEQAFAGPTIRLEIADESAMRGFNPMSVLSLGDGRLLHSDIYYLHGDFGFLHLKQGRLLEDFNTGDLIFPAAPVELQGDQLVADSETLQIQLCGVQEIGVNAYRLSLA
jgi:hypothetical protein